LENTQTTKDGSPPSFVVFQVSNIIFITFQREGFVKKPIAASLFLLILVLAACSNLIQPNPTGIPTLTLTAVPTLVLTNTLLPPTETPDAAAALVPEGQPASEWNGIPIMPDAIAGEGDQESYVFTIKATPQQVQDYYQLELGKLGWQPFGTGEGNSTSLMLMFTNNASATLTISIIAKGDEVLVLLVK
jgi:hypothetical protein